MSVTYQNILDDPELIPVSFDAKDRAAGIDGELEHVEVWEHVPTGQYLVWDTVNEQLSELRHGMHANFMDAALELETQVVNNAPPAARIALLDAIASNTRHRSKIHSVIGQILSNLPGA